jgi:alanyl-tRNA synthetase
MINELLFFKNNDRKICVKGIGRLFYEHGLPISVSVSELKSKGIEVSIIHVADECLKNGWSAKTTLNKLKADFEEDIDKENIYDLDLLERFVYSDYEQQREMIFKYLFSDATQETILKQLT